MDRSQVSLSLIDKALKIIHIFTYDNKEKHEKTGLLGGQRTGRILLFTLFRIASTW